MVQIRASECSLRGFFNRETQKPSSPPSRIDAGIGGSMINWLPLVGKGSDTVWDSCGASVSGGATCFIVLEIEASSGVSVMDSTTAAGSGTAEIGRLVGASLTWVATRCSGVGSGTGSGEGAGIGC